jgi:anti-sigma B factor antagonist
MDQPLGNALITTDPPEAHVVAAGELDIATTSALTVLLRQAVAAGCRDFRVDMARATFCDASTIGLLVGLDRRVRVDGGSLVIVGASPRVVRLLHIVGLESLLSDGEGVHARSTGRFADAQHLA